LHGEHGFPAERTTPQSCSLFPPLSSFFPSPSPVYAHSLNPHLSFFHFLLTHQSLFTQIRFFLITSFATSIFFFLSLPISHPYQHRIPVALLHQHSLALGPLALTQVEEVRHWLHSGVRKAFFAVPGDMPVDKVREELALLPRDRVGVCLVVGAEEAAGGSLAERVTQLCVGASTIVLQVQEGALEGEEGLVELVKTVHQATKPKGPTALPRELVVEAPAFITWSATSIGALHKMEIQALIPAAPVAGSSSSSSSTAPADHRGPLLPLGQSAVDGVDAFLACLRTDRSDGLFTTVVVDECNIALGLVYSSGESVRASVAEQRGIYYSRSRGGLWRKGDSSGAVQELVGLDMDCDSDALRFTVRQRGSPPVSGWVGGWREGRGVRCGGVWGVDSCPKMRIICLIPSEHQSFVKIHRHFAIPSPLFLSTPPSPRVPPPPKTGLLSLEPTQLLATRSWPRGLATHLGRTLEGGNRGLLHSTTVSGPGATAT